MRLDSSALDEVIWKIQLVTPSIGVIFFLILH